VSDAGFDPVAALESFRTELLRWNRQINLVSRQDTAATVAGLVRQCDEACTVLLARERALTEVLAHGPLLYCDLGSGGGLPGFVWHGRLAQKYDHLTTWLVEPREKRAWFLQRVARLLEPRPFGVLQGQWGGVTAACPEPAATALISLKALRLTDPEVLVGLAVLGGPGATPPRQVVIARFHPEGTRWSADLAGGLDVAREGETLGPWRAAGAEVLSVAAGGHEPAALVVSRYTS
jgi:hypothetical protein